MADGTQYQSAVGGFGEPQADQLVPQLLVVADGGGGVPGVERRSEFRCQGVLAALGMPMWRGLACAWVSVRRRRHLADEHRAGFAVAGVAAGWAGRHGERVGCGAALPVIFWRSLGEGRWVTRGGVVLTVNGDRDDGARPLAGGEVACPA